MSQYPQRAADRDQWILGRRPVRNTVDPSKPYGFLMDSERSESGDVVRVATVFLTNRECPWRCLMCDLWKNTLTETVPSGAIAAQIDHALNALADTSPGALIESVDPESAEWAAHGVPATQIKLYNSGSFFDPRAIPVADYPAIAARVRSFDRVIVECHPSLVGERCLRFRDLLEPGNPRLADRSGVAGSGERVSPIDSSGHESRLEVAMGLETANPEVLEKLNKRMTLEDFAGSAAFLKEHGIALRVFVLVRPPFLGESEALHWARRSIDFAFDCGAAVVSLIPTRPGNGALEALAASGEFSPPQLATIEAAGAYGVGLKRGRVFVDLWDLEKFSACSNCFAARHDRLELMNMCQQTTPAIVCDRCQSFERSAGEFH